MKSAASYLSQEPGGQLIPALQFILDHKLSGLLPLPFVNKDGTTDPAGWTNANAQARERAYNAAVRASAIVDTFGPRFLGEKTKSEFDEDSPQLLEWPRTGVVVGGHEIPDNKVPTLICLATAHVAILLINDKDPFGDLYDVSSTATAAGTYLKKAMMGPMSVEYDVLAGADATAAGSLENIEFTVESLLAPLIEGGGGGIGIFNLDQQQ